VRSRRSDDGARVALSYLEAVERAMRSREGRSVLRKLIGLPPPVVRNPKR
jgi:hypothetical protein